MEIEIKKTKLENVLGWKQKKIWLNFHNQLRNVSIAKDYDAQDLDEFQKAILSGCDYNKDGKINKKELTMILLALSKHSNDDD